MNGGSGEKMRWRKGRQEGRERRKKAQIMLLLGKMNEPPGEHFQCLRAVEMGGTDVSPLAPLLSLAQVEQCMQGCCGQAWQESGVP